MHNAHVKLQSCMERISVDEFGLLFAAFAPLQVAMCISLVELPFLSSRLASWLASVTRDNRTGRKKRYGVD